MNNNINLDQDFINVMSLFDKDFGNKVKNMSPEEIKQLNEMRQLVRELALSDFLKSISTEEKSQAKYQKIKSSSNEEIDLMGKISGVPDKYLPLHRAIIKNEDNEFTNKLSQFKDTLQSGDIVLMCGTQWLSNVQKVLYSKARSSHVALVHTDFICIDSVPDGGVQNRLISEVLDGVDSDWRVIRFRNIKESDFNNICINATYYLNQPYRIFPNSKPAKDYAYCSELARKVYLDSQIQGTNIPDSSIISPSYFDRLADENKEWEDITEKVRPYINFCQEYSPICKIISKLYISGLQLNYQRANEQKKAIDIINQMLLDGKISKTEADEKIRNIRNTQAKMNHKFWSQGTY